MEELDLKNTTQLSKSLLFIAETGIYIALEGKFVYISELFERLSGYSKKELIGKYSLDFIHPDDREKVREEAIARLKSQLSSPYEYRFINKNGGIIWVLGRITPIDYGGKKAALGSFMDITERKKIESELQLRAELLDNVNDTLMVTDMAGKIIYVNDTAKYTYKLNKEELLDMTIDQLMGQQNNTVLKKKIIENGELIFESSGFGKDGSNIIIENHTRIIEIGGRKLIIGIGRDVTERKRTQEQFEYMATHDLLTGLPNRTLLNDRLLLVLTLAKRHRHQLAVVMLDIDKFKYINDTFGHLTGDDLLKTIGNKLLRTLRISDTVARIGGDEFVILLPEINSKNDAVEIAEKILKAIRIPFTINDNIFNITTSIGIALYPESGDNAETLMKNADKALYIAKEKGRNRYQIYSN